MPGRRTSPTLPRTHLAYERIKAGFTQEEMAERTGIALPTYRRLERGILPSREAPNPPIRFLINCAIVLQVDWQMLWEPAWNDWLDLRRPAPTDEELEFWRSVANVWPEPSDELLDHRGSFPD